MFYYDDILETFSFILEVYSFDFLNILLLDLRLKNSLHFLNILVHIN